MKTPEAMVLVAVTMAMLGCGGDTATADGADGTPRSGLAQTVFGIDEDASHFVIEGNESASDNPRVSVIRDPGTGQGMFNDGVVRYEIRMLPKPLEKDTLTVWITNLRADTPLGRVEVTDRLETPSILVGVGRGLLKGYMDVVSGHLVLEEIDGELSLSFEAELESNSLLDKARQEKRVTVRGRVVAATIPNPPDEGAR